MGAVRGLVVTEPAHQSLGGTPGDVDVFPVQPQPYLPGAMDAVVRGVHRDDVGIELLAADLPGGSGAACGDRMR